MTPPDRVDPGTIWLARYDDPVAQGYYQADALTYAQLAQFVRKLTIGDATKDSDDYISTLVMGDWSGGGQVEEMNEGADVNRFWTGFADTTSSNRNALGPLVSSTRPNTNCSDCWPLDVGNDGFMYSAFNESSTWEVWGFNETTGLFDLNGGAGVALGGTPVGKAVRFDGVIYVPLGSTGYSRVTGSAGVPTVATVSGAADPTTASPTSVPRPVCFVIFLQRLWCITATGGIAYHTLTQKSAGANAWNWPVALNTTDFPHLESGAAAKAMAVFPDKSGVESLYVKTTRGIYIFDDKNNIFLETHIDFPPHPDINKSIAVWPPGGDLHAGVGLNDVKYSTAFVIDAKFGLARDHGLPVELLGSINDLEATVDRLYAIVGGVIQTNTGYLYSDTVGAAGTGNGQFADVRGLAIDSNGDVYACDTNNERVQRFDSALTFEAVVIAGGAGDGDGEFASNDGPYDLDLDTDDNLYVVDRGNHRIQSFDSSGTYLSEFGAEGYEYSAKQGAAGTGDGEYADLRGIAIDSTGDLVLADENNERVQVLSSALAYESQFGSAGTGDGEFATNDGAWGVAVDEDDNRYVTDRGNNRVQKFNSSGVFQDAIEDTDWVLQGVFGSLGSGTSPNFNIPSQVAVNSSGEVFIADFGNSRVVKLDSSGAYVTSFVAINVVGVAVDPSDNLYICGTLSVGTVGIRGYVQKYNAALALQWNAINLSDGPTHITSDGTYVFYTNSQLNVFVRRDAATGANATSVSFGSTGSGNGQFSIPTGIATDGTHVYVADGNQRVQKFTVAGTYVTQWGSVGSDDGEFSNPLGIAIDDSGDVWVSDFGNNRLQRFSSAGTFQLSIAQPGANGVAVASGDVLWVSNFSGHNLYKWDEAAPFSAPTGIACKTSSGRLYVCDTGRNLIKAFTSALVLENAWGGTGSGNGQFSGPQAVALNQTSGLVYVADTTNNRVQYFTADGGFLGIFTGAVLSGPIGVAVHPTTSHVFVADVGNDVVREYTATGTYVRAFGAAGSGDGQFGTLAYLAFDSSGNLYATDSEHERVQKFTATGPVSGTATGEFSSPQAIAIKRSSGNIYVADTGNHRIQYFDSSGGFLGTWGSSGTGSGQFSSPTGIAVNQTSGEVYVVDQGNDRVQRFTAAGVHLGSWGTPGTNDGQFSVPTVIAVNPNTNNVFVADSDRDDVQEFTSGGTFVRRFGSSGTGNGQFGAPSGIAIDDDGETVFVADLTNEDVQAFVSTTGGQLTAYPSLHVFDGVGWHGQWRGDTFTPVPNVLKAANATDGYRLWWGMTDGFAYYMKLRRTFHNARVGFLAGVNEFATSSSIETPLFDAAMEGFDKLASHMTFIDAIATATETITVEFRVDSGGWEPLGTVSASANKTVLPFDLVSTFSKGRRFNRIAFRFTWARGSSIFATPVLDAATLHYTKIPQNTTAFQLSVPLTHFKDRTPAEQYNDLTNLVTAGEFLPLIHRRDSKDSDETTVDAMFRVLVASISGTQDTGGSMIGRADLSLVAVPTGSSS